MTDRAATLGTVPDVDRAARAVVALLAQDRDMPVPLEVDEDLVAACRRAWRDAGLGPVPTAAVGWLHERSLGAARHAAGAWFTPTELVETVLDAGVAATRGRPVRVLDPACGAGAFLLAALERLAASASVGDRRRAARGLHGADVDAEAVVLCRALLWLAVGDPDLPVDAFDGQVVHGDSLTAPLDEPLDAASLEGALGAGPGERPTIDWHQVTSGGTEPFDLVVGNPPWVRGRTHAQLDRLHRRHVGRLHTTCHGSTWNLWVPFVERSLALADGPVALLVPSALLGAGYAGRLHAHLREHADVHAVHDLSSVGGFDDAVVHGAFVVATRSASRQTPASPVAFVQHRRGDDGQLVAETRTRRAGDLAELPDGHWTLPFADLDEAEVEAFLRPRHGVLGDLVDVRDGMGQDQAYALRELVVEAEDAGTDDVVRLVTTGAIDPGRTTWGSTPVRFLGTTHLRPVVRRDALAEAFPDLAARAAGPKVAVAGLARRLEAVADPDGALLVGKSAMQLTPADGATTVAAARELVTAVASFLNDASTTRTYRAAFGGLGFGGGSFNVRPPALRRLPLPVCGVFERPGGRTVT